MEGTNRCLNEVMTVKLPLKNVYCNGGKWLKCVDRNYLTALNGAQLWLCWATLRHQYELAEENDWPSKARVLNLEDAKSKVWNQRKKNSWNQNSRIEIYRIVTQYIARYLFPPPVNSLTKMWIDFKKAALSRLPTRGQVGWIGGTPGWSEQHFIYRHQRPLTLQSSQNKPAHFSPFSRQGALQGDPLLENYHAAKPPLLNSDSSEGDIWGISAASTWWTTLPQWLRLKWDAQWSSFLTV